MAIISFWNNGKEETGKTSSIIAIATLLAIQHNYKILILDTKYNDYSYEDAYWQEDKSIKLIHSSDTKTNIASGISGLAKAILSNKTSPEIITNYTRIVFKDRLELLTDTKIEPEEYEIHKKVFRDIAKIASRYYDLVLVDIDSNLEENIKNSILEISDLIVVNLTQKMRTINKYLEAKQQNYIFQEKSIIPLLSKYDKYSKYTAKNVARYIKEKKGVCVIPYNTLFFEACEEAKVPDLFLRLRNVNADDRNAFFLAEIKRVVENIIYRLKDLQMKM